MKKRLIILLFALVLTAAACGGDDAADTTAATTAAPSTTVAAATTAAPAAAAAVSVATGALGDYLVDEAGKTLYLFVPDGQSASTCYDGCAAAWPPLTTEVGAGAGVDGALLGTTTRDDGTSQATYNGWPLYYFATDAAAGDTNGQGANDVWFIVDAAGDAIGMAG